MWAIRDSDGTETLHSIYPSWAIGLDHLTVIEMVPKAALEAAVKELQTAQQEINELRKWNNRSKSVARQQADRMRHIEATNNKYYAVIQQYKLYPDSLVDDTPLINVKV